MEYFCVIRVYPEDANGNFDFNTKTIEFQSMDGKLPERKVNLESSYQSILRKILLRKILGR